MAVVMRSGEIRRYDANERLNHWAVAVLFVLLAASGLAFFHPAFWFLSALLGGGTWARILHPFLGVLMFVLFFAMAMRYWTDNKIQPYDREWSKRLSDVIENRDDNLPAIDKYNIGQKWVFWVMVVTMVLMIISGIIMWRPYFADAFAIDARPHRGAGARRVRVHPDPRPSSCISTPRIWVVGTLRAMTRGYVSHTWARHHHPLWYRRMTGGNAE